MELYRISRKKYIRDLSGEGARLYGGRWNHKGVPVLYTSQYESLAALEILVHTPMMDIPDDLQVAVFTIPDDLIIDFLYRGQLQANWRIYPAPTYLADLGSEWTASNTSLAMKVPSVLIKSEWNLLVNPNHEAMDRLEISEIRDFTFDSRIIQ